MKKITILLIILFIATLSACNNVAKTEFEIESEIESVSKLEPEFRTVYEDYTIRDILKENPIDAEYFPVLFEGDRHEYLQNEAHYRDLWRAEVDNTYNALLKILDDEDKEQLKKSQDGWNDYMSGNQQIQISYFYIQKYEGSGQDNKMFAMSYQSYMTRNRAIELMEYLYFITGEVNFLYPN